MGQNSKYEIRTVQSKKDWNDFFHVRREIYKNDPAAVIPLRQMELQQLDPDRHPFYKHARREAFLCFDGKKPIGRIAAIKDDLHNSHYNDKVGFFGFLECPDNEEVATLLIQAAEQWLLNEGCDTMRGPVNPSMKGEFGVLTEGFDIPPFVMMGHSTDYYDSLFQNIGLNVAKQFFAYSFDSRIVVEDREERWRKLDSFEEKVLARYPKLSFRSVEQSNFEETMHDINRLGNKVRARNYGFVPLTPDELDFMIKQLGRIIRMDMIFAAYWTEDDGTEKLVGFIVNVPDLNWALKKTWGKADWIRMPQLLYWLKKTVRTRVIAIGVDDDYLKKGVGMLLINRMIKKNREFDLWEFSWVVEDNIQSMRAIDRSMSLILHKTYRLYEKPILG